MGSSAPGLDVSTGDPRQRLDELATQGQITGDWGDYDRAAPGLYRRIWEQG